MSYHLVEKNGFNVNMPYHSPRFLLKYLMESEPWLLLGGLPPGRDAQQLLETFWNAYRCEQPSHEVYSRQDDFRFIIPLTLHGDGVRTLKKQPLEVVSVQPVLGLDTMEAPLTCSCDNPTTHSGADLSDPCCLRLNSKHNSYLTHFLLFAFPSKKYKKLPGLLAAMLEVVSKDLAAVCTEGVLCQGSRYKFAVLGMKGDMEYHAKTGLLTRSYHNVGHKNKIKVCHECHAGAPMIPFEDFTTGAHWKSTLYADVPWEEPPPFHHIEYENWMSGKAASFFKRDPLHIFRLGVARNFIGSSILLLCFEGYFDTDDDGCDGYSVDKRLVRAWANFALWSDTQGMTCSGIRSFSRDKIHFANSTSFPWVSCKGSDSIILLKWLDWFTKFHLLSSPDSRILQKISNGCVNGLAFQCIHRHGIFCRFHCREKMMKSCKRFCCAYAELAQICFRQGRTLFAMVPKAHALDHVGHSLALSKAAGHVMTVNPALWDCSMAEDFVGAVARQSRRISHKNVCENTLLMYRIKARMVIKNFKKKKQWRL